MKAEQTRCPQEAHAVCGCLPAVAMSGAAGRAFCPLNRPGMQVVGRAKDGVADHRTFLSIGSHREADSGGNQVRSPQGSETLSLPCLGMTWTLARSTPTVTGAPGTSLR